ncbi:MAG TPA: hypothetical protein VMZ53_08565 [Kofleriaceae bacterium]|nr:hypothetical protein [Kofleriaceae bacterium]
MKAFASTASPRTAAIKIVAVYWALLVFGMVLYTAMRLDALAILEPMWAGTIAGTALGQVLAVRRYRTWLAVLLIIAVALFILPHAPPELGGKRLWFAFLPAAMCGYWSLGDRTSLASFWFPAVIWMLSILDGAHAGAMPNGNGLVLFAGLAVLFVVFLRVREERRVALWRSVAPEPLASPLPMLVVKERAGMQLARGAWGVFVTGLGFAATAWLAPTLWKPETHDGKHVAVGAESPNQIGVPCCPAVAEDEPTHTRVKEYFNIGRADTEHHVSEPKDCRVCPEEETYASNEYAGFTRPSMVGDVHYHDGVPCDGTGHYHDVPAVDGYGTYTPTVRIGSYQPPSGTGGYDGSSPSTTGAGTPSSPGTANPWATPSQWQNPSTATPNANGSPYPSGVSITTNVPAPAAPTPSSYDYERPSQPTPPAAQPHHPAAAPTPARPHLASNTSPAVTHNGPSTPVRPDRVGGFELLHWVAVLIAALFFVQLAALLLRPLRRALVLRHLRRPFWSETVDQRVSNAWQLVLVGLRDAGWRADGGEAPREVAKRVQVDGVEDCATILDRARHGIRIDREDLDKMVASADGAYRGARTKVGRFARAISWLRWPLV